MKRPFIAMRYFAALAIFLGGALSFGFVSSALAGGGPGGGCNPPCPAGQACFSGCGTLVQGHETGCVLFQADAGGTYVLSNLGSFNLGDYVTVTGCVDPACVTTCLQGNGCILNNTIAPCPHPQGCIDCCGKKPEFLSAFGSAAITALDTAGNVIVAFDITNEPAPNWSNWFATSFTPSGPQNWSKTNLGSLFGLTLDDQGNIYVTHTTIYGDQFGFSFDGLGALGGANADGAIYKIDTNSGVPSLFQSLPNNLMSPCVQPCGPAPDSCYPGLGNITFSCAHQMFYVSNFEDGRIYRLDSAGNILSTWHHASGTTAAGLPPPDPNGFPPLLSAGRANRVWAVQVNDRLYYSTWREDFDYFNPSCARVDAAQNNEIWSVALTSGSGNGDFILGSEQLELVLPNWSGPSSLGFCANAWSNPVSDISFSPGQCCMLLSERSMASDCTSSAHVSRLLEYCFDSTAGQWILSGNNFQPGTLSSNIPHSSAGGDDYDHRPSGTNAQVWSTADAIKAPPDPLNADPCGPYVYGLIGFPAAGGSPSTNALMIDTDANTCGYDKFMQGDVEITCPPPCVEITDKRLTCVSDPVGKTGFRKDFNVTNNTAVPIQYLLVVVPPPVTVTPNVITFNPPIPPGGTESVNLLFGGMEAGELTCFTMTFLDEDVQECCTIEQCVKPCLQITTESLTCAGAPGRYNYTFILTNLLNEQVEHMFLIPPSGSGITFTPNYFNIPPMGQCGQVVLSTMVNVPAGTTEFCYLATLHNQNLEECCGHDECISLPDCANDSPSDVNNDGAVNVDDLLIVINHWGPCPPPCPADANGNGLVDVDDLLMLINDWG